MNHSPSGESCEGRSPRSPRSVAGAATCPRLGHVSGQRGVGRGRHVAVEDVREHVARVTVHVAVHAVQQITLSLSLPPGPPLPPLSSPALLALLSPDLLLLSLRS